MSLEPLGTINHHGYATNEDDKQGWNHDKKTDTRTIVSTISKSAVDEWSTKANQIKKQLKLEPQQWWAEDEAFNDHEGKKNNEQTTFGCN